MTIEKLAEDEDKLYSIVCDLYNKSKTLETQKELDSIYSSYRQVHLYYSDLASKEDEALKRGLFIQWYAQTEPSDLTGICEIDDQAALAIIKVLESKIKTDTLDNELNWMLNYYANWDYVFKGFENNTTLKTFVQNRTDKYFPKSINRASMSKRGQMGRYWNSLTL